MKQETHVSESKVKTVHELENLIKTKKTILIASIKNIPGSQFQEIVKKLRGKAVVKVPKKNLIFKALDNKADKDLDKLREKIKENFVVLFSDLDGFELAGELVRNQSPAKAKVGQESPIDIEIPEGPTDLVPGPAISELGALGIKIKIDKGKINIAEPKIIAKSGEKISQKAAELMNKLGIRPFKIGFIPLCSFDNSSKTFYSEINIDREGTLKSLKEMNAKTLAFSVSIGYASDETISFLIAKANSHEKALMKLQTPENKESGEENK